jgi:hypothetical protein
MKFFLYVIFLLSVSIPSFAQNGPTKEYPIKVHVSSSELQGADMDHQVLRVVIDGKKYQLIAIGLRPWAVPVGDYRARITSDKPIQGGQYDRRYEFIFPDGKTTHYYVGGESE